MKLIEYKKETTRDYSAPIISYIPERFNKRLIDSGLLYYEASIAGFAERYKHGETSHTLHVWWARRPHSAMRILAFAALCKELSAETIKTMINLSNSKMENLKHARETIKTQYKNPPKVLDMFAGGGTIPFEAASIGTQSYSIDSNELAVFIQKCNLVYSQKVDRSKIKEIIKNSGERVLIHLKKATEELFPLRSIQGSPNDKLFSLKDENTIGYFWTYSIECPQCKYIYFLSKRFWLSRKKDKNIALIPVNGEKRQVFKIVEGCDELLNLFSNWSGKSGSVKCPKCGLVSAKVNMSKTADELIAFVKRNDKKGKKFFLPNSKIKTIPNIKELKLIEKKLVKTLKIKLPTTRLPKWSGIVNPALYGMKTHSDFLNLRQRIVLLMLIKCLIDEYKYLLKTESMDIAKFTVGVLSSMLDQLIDWNCRLSVWISQNEQVGRAFCGPGIPMIWDYVEIDPVMKGPANLWDKLDRIIKGVDYIDKFECEPKVQLASALKLPFDDEFFDAIITDPPYYDNLYYTVLSDFFYSWKRLLLRKIEPELFNKVKTSEKDELVASSIRNGSPELAHNMYCNQLKRVISEAARVLKNDGVIAFIYSHGSIKGWEAIIKAFRESNVIITSVQPLSIERKHRPRAMYSKAINTCVVFVGHKSNTKKQPFVSIDIIKKMISDICSSYACNLERIGWNKSDVALSVFSQGVGLLSNYASIYGVKTDYEALTLLAEEINKYYNDFSISGRNSL